MAARGQEKVGASQHEAGRNEEAAGKATLMVRSRQGPNG